MHSKRFLLLAMMSFLVITGCANKPTNLSQDSESLISPAASSAETKQYNDLHKWSLNHFKDEFGDELPQRYIVGVFLGTFANSATTDSDLLATVEIYNDHNSALTMWEYMDNRAYTLTETLKRLKTKDDKGVVRQYLLDTRIDDNAFIPRPSKQIGIYADEEERRLIRLKKFDNTYSEPENFIDDIIDNETLSCVIEVREKNGALNSVYNFKIVNEGLDPLIQEFNASL